MEPTNATSEADRTSGRQGQLQGNDSGSGDFVHQAAESVRNFAGEASDYMSDAYQKGTGYLPEMGSDELASVRREIREYPLTSVTAAAVIGFTLAWLIHEREPAYRPMRRPG